MALTSGTRLGPYEILSPLGAGSMGEVYRARDTRLHREVALKVLPEAFAADTERLARFQREAEVLASLNHQNIAAIHGLEESDGVRALVLELVEGPTLAGRIAQGAIPLDEALAIARQIADALEAAHEHGVVHRDLKPPNVKLRPDGLVKILDFGIAKATARELPAGNMSQAPTFTGLGTQVGVILGTAAYMSPEQARGMPADARSDIWAFGVILFEMLTGKPAFPGETMVEILGSVLKTDPDWTDLPATTPPIIRSLIRRCLQKDPHRRLRDIADARFQIEDALNEPAPVPAVMTPARKSRQRLGWTAAMLAAIAATAAIMWYFRPAPVEEPEMRLQINTPPGNPAYFALSPDGRSVVFHATVDGRSQLWLRPFMSETAQPLPGTEGASYPFWSPDNRSIAFNADQKLKRIDIGGGTARTLADAGGYGGSWGVGDIILFVPGNTAPVYRVNANGGQPVEATRLDSTQTSHRFPHFLPDGRHFLFFATGASEVQGVHVGSLDSTETGRLVEADTAAVFTPPDYLLFARQDTLLAQRIDFDELSPVGDPFPVAERVAVDSSFFANVALSSSAAGPIAYRTGASDPRRLIWLDRSGTQTGVIGEPDDADLNGARLSPDGSTVAVTRRVNGNRDIWLIETGRGIARRVTFDAAIDRNPFWSPDGSRLAFDSARKGGGLYDLYEKPVGGPGSETLLLETSENKNILDWSPDGRFILYSNQSHTTALDLWVVPLEGDRKPLVVVQTEFNETGGRFSPDGRWIAYQSNETGRTEVYVQPFPGPGPSARISTNGGTNPQWRGDGGEIFYMSPDSRLMTVPVTLTSGSIKAGAPASLFALRPGSQYAPSRDGQQFLVNTPLEDASIPPITIVLNWKPRTQ
jgi:serine/threonine protein kinase/Tol biopolymer transport system component